jgi:hypothetical protein
VRWERWGVGSHYKDPPVLARLMPFFHVMSVTLGICAPWQVIAHPGTLTSEQQSIIIWEQQRVKHRPTITILIFEVSALYFEFCIPVLMIVKSYVKVSPIHQCAWSLFGFGLHGGHDWLPLYFTHLLQLHTNPHLHGVRWGYYYLSMLLDLQGTCHAVSRIWTPKELGPASLSSCVHASGNHFDIPNREQRLTGNGSCDRKNSPDVPATLETSGSCSSEEKTGRNCKNKLQDATHWNYLLTSANFTRRSCCCAA